MFNILLVLYLIIKILYITRIYQQAHYHLKEYILYFIRNYLYINLFVGYILIINLFLDKTYLNLLSGFLILIYAFIFYLRYKVPLVYTRRMKSLICISIISLLPVFFNNDIFKVIYIALFEFLFIGLLLIHSLIENEINKVYIKIARKKLATYKGFKLAITGSFGKTSVKHYIGNIISKYKSTLYSMKSYNTPLGISKMINNNNLDIYDILIFEMGATKESDIDFLMDMIKPDMTIITSIGYMHLDTFKSISKLISEKIKAATLLPNSNYSIINFENEYLRNQTYNNQIISYGFSYGKYRAKNITDKAFDLYIDGIYYDSYEYNLKGEFNILNLLATIITLLGLKIDKRIIKMEIKQLTNYKNRLEIKEYDNLTILDDSFNSNLDGAINALKVLGTLKGKRFIITPGFVEMKKEELKNNHLYAAAIKNYSDIAIIIRNRKLYNELINLKHKAYLFDSLNEGFLLFNNIKRKEFISVLIENDLPDIYQGGF